MPATIWQISCFGSLTARGDGSVIDRFQTQKTGMLLAYLAFYAHRRPSREELIGILWPDVELDTGRNRLSQALAWLRTVLEPAGTDKGSVLVTDRLNVGLNPAVVVTDVGEFQAAAKAAESIADPAAQVPALVKVCDLYQGQLLPGYYDDWVLTERQRLLDIYLRSLRRLIAASERSRDFEHAIEYAQRAIAADPLAEELHCELMRVLASSGQSVAALRHYQELERILARELGLTPSATVRALADQIRQDDREVAPPTPVKHEPVPAIPAPLNRFFGRESEIARVRQLLETGGVRLITLTGVGGAGKTRLALEIAARLSDSYRGIVSVVPLADLRDARLVPAAVADRLQLPRYRESPIEDQLVAHLRQHRSLLVLDNLEHLVDGAVLFIRDLLERVPSLTILATSQSRLGLDGEREIPVPPLAAPGGQAAPDKLMQVASVQLFVDRAQAVRPDFEVTERNAADIARICDRLEGIPLAIELCAAWVQALSPSQMLAQLEHGFDLLVSRRSDSQPRHRSLRAAVEHSYQLLSPELRQFFIRLAIFRGGWTLQAAEAVAQIELPQSTEASEPASMQPSAEAVIIDSVSTLDYLMRLRDRSLILSEEIGPEMRYRMLDALRDFARQQRSPEIDARLSRWHAEYFLALAEQAEPHFTGPDQAVWLDRLKTEHDNFRSALSWAIAAGEAEIGLRLASTLAPFWFVRGHLAEGQEWLSRITAMPQSEADDLKRARAKALGAWGMLARNQGHLPKVTAALEEALRLWRDLNDERGIAITLQTLATCAYSVEDWDSASRYLEESMKIMPKLDDPVLQARAYINLGNLSLARSEWQRAHSAYSEGLRRYRELGDRIGMSSALNNLGLLAIYEADLSASITLLNESLAIARELGNQSGTAVAILNLAHVNRILGCYDIARSLIYEGGTTALEAGERRLQPECLTEAGYVACAEQKYGLGAKLLSAGESLRVAMGISAGPFGKKDLEAARSLARSVLGDAAFEAAWAEGKHLSFTQAFSMAMVNENVTLSDRSA